MNAAEGWSLLALAYDVTPDLLSLSFALTEAEALLMADEIPDELDGGRRLPTSIAGAVINASTPTTVRKVNDLLEDHFKVLKSTNDGKWLPPTHAEIGLAFHTAWNSGSLAMIDRCLLANFRTSLSFCSNLHAALSRMLSIAPMSNELAQGVLERLQVIEKIQAGWADDETVLRFFERISDNTADFSRSQRAVAYYQLGHCYFMSGQDDLAAVSLEYAVELDSTYYNAWSLLGVVYDLNKRQRQAIVALREAIKLNGKYEFAHFNLGTIYERRGQLVEAAHSYVAAMKCAPSFYEAAYNLSNTLLELHLIRDAVQVATFTGAIAHEMRVEPIFNIANPHYS
jgi:tetratricopeptide (TPR) repeat protein